MAVDKRRTVVAQNSCSCAMPGVWRAVAHNPGCVVVYHAPRACTHVTGTMDLYQHYHDIVGEERARKGYTAPLVSTNITDKQTIFGGGKLLGRCLDYVVATYHPEYIVVANSCISGVIGDDTEGICREKEREHGLPIINTEAHGFLDGEYYGGYCDAAKRLVDRFMTKEEERCNQICVLGEKGGPYSRNAQDISCLFAGFHVDAQQRFPSYCSLADFQLIAKSRWLVPLGGSAKAYEWMSGLAQYMGERLGMDVFDADYPVGIAATYAWLERLGHFLGQPERIEYAQAQACDELETAMDSYRAALDGIHAVIVLGRRLANSNPHWVLEMTAQVGMHIDGIVFVGAGSRDSWSEWLSRWKISDTLPIFTEENAEEILSETDLVLTTVELEGAPYKQLFLPMVPPIGMSGLTYIYRRLFQLSCYRRRRGVILNGW